MIFRRIYSAMMAVLLTAVSLQPSLYTVHCKRTGQRDASLLPIESCKNLSSHGSCCAAAHAQHGDAGTHHNEETTCLFKGECCTFGFASLRVEDFATGRQHQASETVDVQLLAAAYLPCWPVQHFYRAQLRHQNSTLPQGPPPRAILLRQTPQLRT